MTPTATKPTLFFTPYAQAKLIFFRDLKGWEVSGFGITGDPDYRNVVTDFRIVKQVCNGGWTGMDDKSISKLQWELCNPKLDEPLLPDQCCNIWIHTHPGNSAAPSPQDIECFKETFEREHAGGWAIMMILARGGQTTCKGKFRPYPMEKPNQQLPPWLKDDEVKKPELLVQHMDVAVTYEFPFPEVTGEMMEQWEKIHGELVTEKVYVKPKTNAPATVVGRGYDHWGGHHSETVYCRIAKRHVPQGTEAIWDTPSKQYIPYDSESYWDSHAGDWRIRKKKGSSTPPASRNYSPASTSQGHPRKMRSIGETSEASEVEIAGRAMVMYRGKLHDASILLTRCVATWRKAYEKGEYVAAQNVDDLANEILPVCLSDKYVEITGELSDELDELHIDAMRIEREQAQEAQYEVAEATVDPAHTIKD